MPFKKHMTKCQLASNAGVLAAQLLLQRCKSLIITDACAAAATICRPAPTTDVQQHENVVNNTTSAAAIPAVPPPPASPALFALLLPERCDDSSAAAGALATRASLCSLSLPSLDAQPPTPLSAKVQRRQQLMQHELVEEGEAESRAADFAGCDARRDVASPDNAIEQSEVSFASVAAQLEEEDLARKQVEQMQHHQPQHHQQQQQLKPPVPLEASSTLVPLVTPRDSAACAATVCTPYVFSTTHLKSPSQVRRLRHVALLRSTDQRRSWSRRASSTTMTQAYCRSRMEPTHLLLQSA